MYDNAYLRHNIGHRARRYAGLVLMGVITVTLACACSSTPQSTASNTNTTSSNSAWSTTLQTACKEGTLTYDSTQQQALLNKLVAGFESAYPCIHVNANSILGPILITKLQQEASQPTSSSATADVVMQGNYPDMDTLSQQHELIAPNGPNATNYPASLKKGYAPIYYEAFVIIYNKNLVKTPPTGYAALLNPSLKGKIGITSVLNSASVESFYTFLNTDYGANYLTKLAQNQPKVYLGVTAISSAVASGEISYGLFALGSATEPLIQSGAPIGIVLPNPAHGTGDFAGIVRWAKHPAAAQVFMNYLMSQAAAELFVKNGGGYLATEQQVPNSVKISQVTEENLGYSTSDINAFTSHFNALFIH